MTLSIVLWIVILAPILLSLSHWHGRAYQRRRSNGMSVYASVRVPGLPRWLGARVGVHRRL